MIAAVQQAFPQVSIRQLCRWLGLGRTWYYTRPTPEERAARDVALRDAIERIILAFPGYGYRRVTHALHREGWAVNHKRVLRIMPQEAVRRRCCASCDASLWRRRTPRMATRPIPIGNRTSVMSAPNQVWVADITDVRLPTTFGYLACVLDAFSRRCGGWQLSRQIDTQLTLAALEMALTQRQPAPGLIHHSDRGVQYASLAYVARLEQAERDPGQHVRQGQSL